MRDKLRTLLQIESGEESKVSMLLTQSVFLGIFVGAFDITVHSLFLSIFSEKMLARAYIVTGITGLIIVFLRSWLKSHLKFRKFLIAELLIVTILTFFFWLLLKISPTKELIFIVFVMFGPLNILALAGFWGMTKRILNTEKGKGILNLIDAGQITGIIIISFVIPILVSSDFKLTNVLFISASSVFIVALIQVATANKFRTEVEDAPGDREKALIGDSPMHVFREGKYIRMISLFTAFSILTVFVIQYLFLAATRELYPVAENMAIFLGLFIGGMMVLILILKPAVFKYILYKHGLRTCLFITPLLLCIITALTIAIGLLIGYTPDFTSGFVFFFVLLATLKLISKSFMDSVEIPSLKIIYQFTDQLSRTDIHSVSRRIFNETMVVFSGIILTGFGLLSSVKLIHFALILFILALVWLFIAFRLFKEYRRSIFKLTEKANLNGSSVHTPDLKTDFKNRFATHLAFRIDYFRLISGDYAPPANLANKWYYERIIDYAASKKDINLIEVLKKTTNDTDFDEKIRQKSAEVVKILQDYSNTLKSGDEKTSDSIRILSGTRKPQTTEIFRLFRDNSVESKRLAIYMIGKFRLSDLLREVCESLNNPALAIDASEVLRCFGSAIESELVKFYLIKSGNPRLSRSILQLFAENCTIETKGFLFSRLWSNSRQLKEVSVKRLINCGFIPDEAEKQRLDQLISEITGIITWYLAARISLKRDRDNFLVGKISLEIDRWTKILFDILSITYNPGAIGVIKENVHKGTIESITYALEMTDIVVSDFVKQKLIYLLDMVSDDIKLRNLSQFFPGDIPIRKRLLEDIINLDYNLISLWTKACTLRSISRIESEDMTETVTALLFSPEKLIQEESANLIARSNSEIYVFASERIPEAIRKHLDKIINGKTRKEELLFEKVNFLTKFFKDIDEDELLPLACEMKFKNNFDPDTARYSGGILLWPLSEDNEDTRVHVLFEGELGNLTIKNHHGHKISYYILPLSAVEQYHFQFPEKSLEILKYIDINEVFKA